MTLCFIAFCDGPGVFAPGCFTRTPGAVSGVRQTETGGPKHLFFITVTIRLQSRDIQVTDSDTNLYTGFYSDTFTLCQRGGTLQNLFTLLVNGVTLMSMVCTGSCYVHACVLILDGTTGNRIITNGPRNVIKECFRQSAFLLINIYIYFNFQQYRTHQTLDSITHRFHLLQ